MAHLELALTALSRLVSSEFETCKMHTRKYIHCGHIKIADHTKCDKHKKHGGWCNRSHMEVQALKSRRKR